MFKITMSIFSLAVFLFGMSLQASTEIPVKILSASYNAANKSVEVLVDHQNGGCVPTDYSLTVRGCTDMFVPYSCVAILKGSTEQVCDKEIFEVIPFSVEQLGLSSKKYQGSTLTIQGTDSGKSMKKVKLQRI